MKLLKAKDGKLNISSMDTGTVITGIIMIVLALKIFAVGLPEIASAGNEVSSAGCANASDPSCASPFALTGLFASDSVLILAIVGAVLLAVILQVLPKKGR